MQHIAGGEQRLIIDFGRLNFISRGMRVLLIAAKKLQASGTIVLCDMKAHIREVFSISGFDRIIPIKDSRESALAASN